MMANSILDLVGDDAKMTPRRTMELLWADATAHLPQTDGEVLLPRNVVDNVIGVGHLNTMGLRLACMLNKKVDIIMDESINAYRMIPKEIKADHDEDLWADEHDLDVNEHRLISTSVLTTPASKLPARPTKVPRPPNCFILYRQANHHLVKSANPGVSNNEISRILGARWNNESPEVRMQFTRLADDLKREHAIKHPDYQYAPRRPGDRKRRAPRIRTHNGGSRYNFNVPDDNSLIEVDDILMSDLSNDGLLFGPNGVEPISAPYSYDECIRMGDELASGNSLASMQYTPMPFESDNSDILMPTVF
ncbi:High mobility group superfamily [Penicillium sp. CMV-2018d]|nr:High mobility group superfamily [Penicillium sp. CMV-2018d]